MKALSGIGLAVAATVGGAAALSWCVWVLVAFSSAPSEAKGQGAAMMSQSERAGTTGAVSERSRNGQGISRVAISRRPVAER